MTGRLEHKIALITGAAQGIGAAAAQMFVGEGARVIATDINVEAITRADGTQAHCLDVCDRVQIEQAAQQFGAIDILFNCAGIVHDGTILQCSEEDWNLAMDVNVRAMYRLTRAFLPAMIANGGGNIINMASVASSISGVPNRFAYSASKAAVIGLTKSIAADFVSDNIRCNAICPGTVATPSLEERINQAGDPVQARRDFLSRQPMGRLGKADEIAALALYLASNESAYTTGTIHIIDGGWTN